MSSINDFKIVNQHCMNCFKRMGLKDSMYSDLSADDQLYEKQKLGFYLMILEYVTGIKEVDELIDMITDTKFLSDVYGIKNNDMGIDAVYIDEEEKCIKIFNFKFRRNFKANSVPKEKDVYDSVRFFASIENEKTDDLDSRTKQAVQDIIDKYKSNDPYETKFYMVANVDEPFEEIPGLDQYKTLFDIDIISIVLGDIITYISNSPEDKCAELFVDADAILTYEPGAYSTSKSFLIKMPVCDLIRITCSNDAYRCDCNCDYELLNDASLEMGFLYENVRGYLGDTKYNRNILMTLDAEPDNFFMYNNGITITATNITSESKNAKKKVKINIEGFQIVNGGQTVRSIYRFLNEHDDVDKLSNASVLVRLFQTERDNDLKNKIAEYTNSQNAISPSDLKSICVLQEQIESFLMGKRIAYKRKTGDTGKEVPECDNSISMERMAQIIYSYNGYPDRASNNKKQLFDKYYNDIFPDDLDFDMLYSIVEMYFSIVDEYKKYPEIKAFPQKYFLVLFIKSKKPDITWRSAILFLEEEMNKYDPDSTVALTKKITRVDFKEKLELALKSI